VAIQKGHAPICLSMTSTDRWALNEYTPDQLSIMSYPLWREQPTALPSATRSACDRLDGRAKSTAERLEIFACTDVPASEYEVLLPGGMRREALGAGSTHACNQERIDLVQRSRRKLARAQLRANRTAATNTAVRTAEPVAPQRLAPPAGVRGRLERPGLINVNKRRWQIYDVCWRSTTPSAHSRTARSGTCASARASDTNTHKGTSQHTPAGLLPRRTDDQQN
jgi:hypothetical protein